MGVGTVTSNAVDGECAVISAVRAGDTDLVRTLLRENNDPDYLDAAFCLAVRMPAGHIAQLLLQYGADSGQSRPEDLIPLSEGGDSGSPALFEALLGHEIRGRYPETEFLEARDLARRWHETGPGPNCDAVQDPGMPSSVRRFKTTSTTASTSSPLLA